MRVPRTPSARAVPGSLVARIEQRPWPSVLVGAAFLAVALFALAAPVDAGDETCHPIEATWYSPTGIAGCTLDGPTDGLASWYGGDVAAANWCEWPWDDCGWIRVQSHATGLAITVPVAMYGDLYTNTARERLVDLTYGQVLALGLDPADGTFDVTVTPLTQAGQGLAGAGPASPGIEQAGGSRLDESPGAVGRVGVAPPPVSLLPDTAVAMP